MKFCRLRLLFFVWMIVLAQLSVAAQIKNNKAKDAGSNFEAVYQILVGKPDWLFTEDVCPLSLIPNYETKIEYLSEGCADDAEKCLNKCKAKDGNACYSLALLVQEKKGLLQDYSERLFLRSCRLGIVSGCTNRAAAIFNLNEDDSKQVKCAVDTFEKTCEKNDSWGCTMFGLALAEGLSRPKNTDEALRVLSKSCKISMNGESCVAAKELIKVIEKNKNKTN